MKVLFCGEASFLKSGYAIYGKNLISRIHATEGFEVAEFANYASSKDARIYSVPWKLYCNMPENDDEHLLYAQNPTNAFGAWKFERVCLDFKPDIVISYLDSWMMRHQLESPFRPFYKLIWMPAVDASPQNTSWLNMYSQLDAAFGYTDWAVDILNTQGGGLINTIESAHYCAEPAFQPVLDKAQHKNNIGLDNTKIIGFVSRNQRRKLFPDLFAAFRSYIDKYEQYNTMLYCHTTYPDGGWNLPQLLKDYGLSNKVLFTYVCRGCGEIKPSVFHDAGVVCEKCGKVRVIANLDVHIPAEALSQIMNCFDLYVHYGNSEAWGMAQIEAAACGVPVMAIDYAGMGDIVHKLGGIPLKPKGFSKEIETGCMRAIPDNDELVEKLHSFFTLPDSVRVSMGIEIRDNFDRHYNWNTISAKWIDHLKTIEHDSSLWQSPSRIRDIPPFDIKPKLNNSQFVRWLITDVWGDSTKIGSMFELMLLRNLVFSTDMESYPAKEFTREDAYNRVRNIANNINHWEKIRLGL